MVGAVVGRFVGRCVGVVGIVDVMCAIGLVVVVLFEVVVGIRFDEDFELLF